MFTSTNYKKNPNLINRKKFSIINSINAIFLWKIRGLFEIKTIWVIYFLLTKNQSLHSIIHMIFVFIFPTANIFTHSLDAHSCSRIRVCVKIINSSPSSNCCRCRSKCDEFADLLPLCERSESFQGEIYVFIYIHKNYISG